LAKLVRSGTSSVLAQSRRKTQSRRSCKSFESASLKWKNGRNGGKKLKRISTECGWTVVKNYSLRLTPKPNKARKNLLREYL